MPTDNRSTSADSQRTRIMQALVTGPKTSYDLRRIGCYQCPTRVLELRRMGHDIRTQRVSIWDANGYRHCGVALYSLEVA
ncbi:helix-turn-helix domain-containing protein [Castellaniella sp.]|uniref:helix-turn-helix domain-containing protein n=1 Tax=Castellaniella sp. TaxID=1955812 RepID=UPI0025BC5B51|nr:helix-turn-helix domain-containing protein [Castellaniella sp.]